MARNPVPPVRTEGSGWSRAVTRRNELFLMQVDSPALTGRGYAMTFTVKECPATSHAFSIKLRNLIRTLKDCGLIRYHWVIEMQRPRKDAPDEGGVPHVHISVWFPHDVDPVHAFLKAEQTWLSLTAEYGSKECAQKIRIIDADTTNWFRYLVKHMIRGVTNVQRAPDSYPTAWKKTRGRAWGRGGHWPMDEHQKTDLLVCTDEYSLRRRCEQYQFALARCIPDKAERIRAILYVRKMRRVKQDKTTLKLVRKLHRNGIGIPESLQLKSPEWYRRRSETKPFRFWGPAIRLAQGFVFIDLETGELSKSDNGKVVSIDDE